MDDLPPRRGDHSPTASIIIGLILLITLAALLGFWITVLR